MFRDGAYLSEVLQRLQERVANGGSGEEQLRLMALSYPLTGRSPAKMYERLKVAATGPLARDMLVDVKQGFLKQIGEDDFGVERNLDLLRMFLSVSMDQYVQAQQNYDSLTPSGRTSRPCDRTPRRGTGQTRRAARDVLISFHRRETG
jgi:hypothetical protein